jgi:zinc transporter ZupT
VGTGDHCFIEILDAAKLDFCKIIEIALALAAGFFLYIAASDIIPEIHENPRRLANIQAILLVVGVLVIAAITANTSHQHEASPASHEAEHHTE